MTVVIMLITSCHGFTSAAIMTVIYNKRSYGFFSWLQFFLNELGLEINIYDKARINEHNKC